MGSKMGQEQFPPKFAGNSLSCLERLLALPTLCCHTISHLHLTVPHLTLTYLTLLYLTFTDVHRAFCTLHTAQMQLLGTSFRPKCVENHPPK